MGGRVLPRKKNGSGSKERVFYCAGWGDKIASHLGKKNAGIEKDLPLSVEAHLKALAVKKGTKRWKFIR